MTDQRCVRFFYWGTRFCCEMINALWFSYSVCFKYLERPNKQKNKKQSKRETFHKEMIVDTKRLVQDLGNTKTCKAKKKRRPLYVPKLHDKLSERHFAQMTVS